MLTVRELVGLWRGDAFCCGYMHPEIVVAVCEQVGPNNVDSLRLRFYPSQPKMDVDEDALMILEHGFSVWKERGQPMVQAA